MNSLLIVFSYHHNNTLKVANEIAKILEAEIKKPSQIIPEELQNYNLIGFGSGIYSTKHHKSLLELASKLPQFSNKKAFIFSTDGSPRMLMKDETILRKQMLKNHRYLKKKLRNKGYNIIDEFNCAGFNTNKFIKIFGGINKGRPNEEDIKKAENFAKNLLNFEFYHKM